MGELLSYAFIQNALLAAVCTSILCGMIGPFVVTKRLVFMSEGMSHISFGGIGLAYYLGLEHLFLGALVFSVLFSLILANIHESQSQRKDSFIGIFCAFGITLGTLCIYQKSGYTPDLMHYLFGNILNISFEDVRVMIGFVLCIGLLMLCYFREFVILSFDPKLLKLKGMPDILLQSLLYVIIAVSVTTLIHLIGTMLSTSFLTLSVNLGLTFVRSMKRLIIFSILVNLVFIMLGFLLSYYVDIPSGPAIFLMGFTVFLLCRLIQALRKTLHPPNA